MNVDAIPQELRELARWIVWRWEDDPDRPGHRRKPPYCPADPDRHASSTNPETWGSFEQAVALVEAGRANGIGLALEPPLVGVDLDDELSEADQAAIVLALRSYTERSPSGTGHHVVLKAHLNGRGRHPQGLGVFTRDRFFYFTGAHVPGTPATIEERQAELEEVLEHFLPARPEPAGTLPPEPVSLDDHELLERAFAAGNGAKFRALWEGDTSGYGGDDSAADLALCSLLAFWTGRDPERIDRLFRSSGLYREKWERDDYRERTIEVAIAGTTEIYSPRAPREAEAEPALEEPEPEPSLEEPEPVLDDSEPEPSLADAEPATEAKGRAEPRPRSPEPEEEAEPRSTVAVAGWPLPPSEAAFSGLAGRIVHTIEPHSEADPVALLVQLLVVFGNLVGRDAHFTVEADNHHANLYAGLVGPTSKGRKGSAWGHVERLGRSTDDTWGDRVESGLSSGEGLIWAVRDAVTASEGGEEKIVDEGIADKRLLVFEPEFANVLRVLERQGNRLSSVVRDGWDGRVLRTLTRTTQAKATRAHISIVGHITADELRRYLDRTEIANGFGNRFLWLCVRRSKALPDGGQMHKVDVRPLVDELRDAVRFAGTQGRVERDASARALWHEVYGDLSEGFPGLVGALTGRAEAQVTRLALVYALLDLSPRIGEEHLRAALALWDYSLRSVRYVFGMSLGDPIADTILELLRQAHPRPASRSEIRKAVGGRVGAAEIERALALIARHGLARMRREETGGRSAEVWELEGRTEQ